MVLGIYLQLGYLDPWDHIIWLLLAGAEQPDTQSPSQDSHEHHK